ncbi:alpha/beta fold hydrolase [Nocardia wallacei]|uniref:alpha/beta fold hydrolase n=1 Tax=Nocardia wallacei TaxID=480035 RepID=UPI002457BEEB|nr:alpha/beta hydrolase [Nocardia wallacei]
MRTIRKAILTAVSAAAIVVVGAPVDAEIVRPTIVLVHGAFADATSWDDVAAELRADGYRVVVPDNPLRGPGSDAAVIEQALAGIDGPIVLVGHSYGGAVITNVADPDVRALVYIAAFAPAPGEPMFSAIDPLRFPGSRLLPPALSLTVTNGGLDGYVDPAHFHQVFAQDVGDVTAANMIAHQRSIAAAANLEPSGPAAWSTTPSWFLVSADDRVIPPAAQRFMAQRAGSHTTEVAASHASLVSRPAAVVAVIEQAAL